MDELFPQIDIIQAARGQRGVRSLLASLVSLLRWNFMNPLRLFQRRARDSSHPQAHMTWVQTSVGRTVTRASLFLKKQLWVWPVMAIVILSIVAIVVRSAIESTMKANLRSQLQTLLTAETAMLK